MRVICAAAAAASVLLPQGALALSLPEAIALAQQSNPGLAETRAQADAAKARLTQARAGRFPTLVLSGESGEGRTDLGGFFGFGRSDVSPRAAALELRQPLFTGGAVTAGIARAREGREASLAQLGGARAMLSAQVAEAYVGVLSAVEFLALHEAQVAQTVEVVRQADLRFSRGEIARTDVAQAQARLAEARAGLARAKGDVARSRARFQSVVGVEADGLEPAPATPATPESLEAAVARAERNSPALLAAEAAARAAAAGVRYAQAERLPSFALAASASTMRDKFFPGYRSEDVTVGVQGRWTLFAGGAVNGRVGEARAGARAAEAARDKARAQVREAVIDAWAELQTSEAVLKAAADQAEAAAIALENVRHEVRVGQKPTLDLLDAQRESLAAQGGLVAARGGAVTAAYRLNALIGAD